MAVLINGEFKKRKIQQNLLKMHKKNSRFEIKY